MTRPIEAAARRLRAQFGWDGPAPPATGPALLILSGLPGTGKSFLAEAISAWHPIAVVRSDEVRKALFPQPDYGTRESGVVYLTCHALLLQLLADGYTVAFDATNLSRTGRRRARAIARRLGAPALTLLTTAPPAVVESRLRRRAAGESAAFASDADWTVHHKLAATAESIGANEPSLVVDTSRPLGEPLRAVAAFLTAAGRYKRDVTTNAAVVAAPMSRPVRAADPSDTPETFGARVRRAIERTDSLLCVGLDVELEKLPAPLRGRDPAEAVVEFNRAIIDATQDLAAAYKPNLAFYEALGPAGLEALRRTVALVPPGALTIGDAKRGDIGNTMRLYAQALFDVYGFQSVTLSPFLGRDSLQPFLDRRDRGIFALCRTSNDGATDILEQPVDGRPLFLAIAERVQSWNENRNLGLVVGATFPRQLAQVRQACPDLPILLPGVGAQQGDLEASVNAGTDRESGGLLVVSARQVLYASSGADFATAARRVAQGLRDRINAVRAGGSIRR